MLYLLPCSSKYVSLEHAFSFLLVFFPETLQSFNTALGDFHLLVLTSCSSKHASLEPDFSSLKEALIFSLFLLLKQKVELLLSSLWDLMYLY